MGATLRGVHCPRRGPRGDGRRGRALSPPPAAPPPPPPPRAVPAHRGALQGVRGHNGGHDGGHGGGRRRRPPAGGGSPGAAAAWRPRRGSRRRLLGPRRRGRRARAFPRRPGRRGLLGQRLRATGGSPGQARPSGARGGDVCARRAVAEGIRPLITCKTEPCPVPSNARSIHPEMSSRAPRVRPGCGARGDGPGREAQGSTGRQGLRDVGTPRGHPEPPSEQRPPARHEQRAAEPAPRH